LATIPSRSCSQASAKQVFAALLDVTGVQNSAGALRLNSHFRDSFVSVLLKVAIEKFTAKLSVA
jgi:hypothetical protein